MGMTIEKSPYSAKEIYSGFWDIDEGGVRSFLVVDNEEALLIDTGFGRGDLAALVHEITDKPVRVLNTHADGDHTGCNGSFGSIYMHPAEYDRYCFGRDVRTDCLHPVWEGDVICAGDYRFEVILIPGHTPGSIALLEKSRRFLISGDSVQTGAAFMFGQGRNLPAYRDSIKKLMARRGEFDTVHPSHGELNVPADMLDDIYEASGKLLAGELEGRDPGRQMPCKLYEYKRAKFLY